MSIKSKLGTAAVLAALLAAPAQMAFASGTDAAASDASSSDAGAILMGVNGDTGNSWYGFPFSSGDTDGTDGRPKQDYSSTYIRVDRMDMRSCKVYVDGARSKYGPYANQVSYWSGSSVGNSATVRSTGEFQIMNRVRENGLSWARLTGWAYDGGGTLSGYWSPDSWGTYPKIND